MNYAETLSCKFGLDLNKKFYNLSTGYKTIYKIIGALASNAEIVIYDEPVLGLDVNHRDIFYKELIKKYDEVENTIIISTHLIEEISNIIEKVIVVEKGKIIINDEVSEILEKSFKIKGKKEEVDKFTSGKNIISTEDFKDLRTTFIYESIKGKELEKNSGLDIEKIKLQDLYLALTNN